MRTFELPVLHLILATIGAAAVASCAHVQNAGDARALDSDSATASVATQSPATAPNESPAATRGTLESLAWLAGCWRGNVNQREFREDWMPARGGMMLGVTQTVTQGATQDYAYLRIDKSAGGILQYVVLAPGQPELKFRYVASPNEPQGDELVFVGAAGTFPERIVYHRGEQGWLYASAEGRVRGEDKRVTYPLRRIGCESGALVHP